MDTRDLILKFQGGGSSLPREDLVQHLVSRGSSITKNANTGIYELVDRIGAEIRPIQDGRCWNFDGESNYVELLTQPSLQIGKSVTVVAELYHSGITYIAILGGIETYSRLGYNNDGNGKRIVFGSSLTWDYDVPNSTMVKIRIERISALVYECFADDVCLGEQTDNNTNDFTFKTIGKRDAGGASELYFMGKLSYIKIESDTFPLEFSCEEQAGNIARSIDTSHKTGTIHGTIAGFHAIDKTREDSRANEVGYALKDGIDGLIPLDLNGNPTVENCDTVYNGRVKYNEKIIGTNYLEFDGESNYIDLGDIGYSATPTVECWLKFSKLDYYEYIINRITAVHGEAEWGLAKTSDNKLMFNCLTNGEGTTGASAMVDIDKDIWYHIRAGYDGTKVYLYVDKTYVKTVASLNITHCANNLKVGMTGWSTSKVFSGSIAYMKVNDNIIVPFSEGNSNKIYNKVDGAEYTVAGTIDDIWQQDTTGLLRPSNAIDGFDLWEKDADGTRLEISFDINGNSIKTDGDTITGYTWQSRNSAGSWLNNTENSLLGYPSPVMRNKVDKDIELIYDSAGDVKAYSPSELQFDQEDQHKEFADVNKSNEIKNIVRYEEALTGSNLVRVDKFIKKP